MDNLPFILLALACPIGMGLMMLLMGRGMMGMGRGGSHEAPTDSTPRAPADPEKKLALLQAQRQLIDAQIDSIEGSDKADGAPAQKSPAER